MKITDAFRGEHGVFYAQFDWLEAALDVPGSVERVRDLAAMLGAALEPHAQMEDELLFDMLGAEGRTGAFAVMRAEHERIEEALQSASWASDAARAAELLLQAIEQAREHFLKEEQVAFPLAEQVLGSARLHALGDVWAARRAVSLAR
jgi:iron-sulfur cluster repair protein YtfE (RIC family)